MSADATFDPDQIARYEVAGWRAYYDHRWGTLLRLTVTLCQEQFQIPFPRSLLAAYEIVRASIAWVPVEHDLARVTEHLTRFYALAALRAARFRATAGRRCGGALLGGQSPPLRPARRSRIDADPDGSARRDFWTHGR